MPGIWHHGCCCGDPCTDCAAATPGATVTVAGACADGGGNCNGAAGNYTFSSFNAGACRWTLKRTVGADQYWIWFEYNAGTSVWKGHIQFMPGGIPPQTDLFDRSGISISCSGGALAGTFDLDGLAPPGCNGCTATVTLT